MIRNFLINILFSIPVWLIELVYKFNKDVKRGFIFDSQSRMLFALMPKFDLHKIEDCLLYTSPSPRDLDLSRMPSSA